MVKNSIIISLIVFTALFTQACGGGGSSSSSTGNVVGTVTDASSNATISGVTVQIGSKSDVTGDNGVYTIENLNIGERTITASQAGYQTYNGTVHVQNSETTTHSMEMTFEGGDGYERGSRNWNEMKWDEGNWE